MLNDIRRRLGSHSEFAIALLTICISLPFLGKPFNIDDPLFLWTARQIQAHLFNPFGFNVFWGWGYGPMWLMTDNPPLTSYYIAVGALILGWSEIAMHLLFLIPALAVVLGTFRLARLFSAPPAMAAAATLFTPGFLVSSTTVMSDVPMLALWTWAVIWWMNGIERKQLLKCMTAALLVTAAELTKYYGICLVPLLAAYSLAAKKRAGSELLFLLIPVGVLCAYQYLTRRAYGMDLVFDVAHFSLGKGLASHAFCNSCLTTLVFVGGCFATVLFFAPLLWKKQAAIVGTVTLLAVCAVLFGPSLLSKYSISGNFRTSAQIQMALWAAAGASALALAVSELLARRDAKSLMLMLWVLGTFLFTAFCNWTINARAVLPMAPALGVLISQRIKRNFDGSPIPILPLGACIAVSAVFALYVTDSDCLMAIATKQNVLSIYEDYGQNFKRLHFEGHWGFQYYMSQLGASPLDYKHARLGPGDIVAIPPNNTNILPLDPGKAVLLEMYSEPASMLMTTVSPTLGAGFYASVIGPLPFVIGPVPRETVAVYSLR